MNLYRMLSRRAADRNPIRVGLVGAGKFGAMFLAQARTTPGLHIAAVADLSIDRAREALDRTGWRGEEVVAPTLDAALAGGKTLLTEDAAGLIEDGRLEVVVEATGVPAAGVRHALACIEHGVNVVMVNVEADALAGPLLARRAAAAGVHYSLAYGDQPALICEQVDWARAAGFEVVAAGKGTKYLPRYHQSTPVTVWDHYGFTEEQVAAGGFNPRMFNSFLDGTKSAIEMAAVANATGLVPQSAGLKFPPVGVDDLPRMLCPAADGGLLEHAGTVEVISSLERDGRAVERDLRWGVYVTFEAPGDYTRRCFGEYGLVTDPSGRYSALYRPFHLIGLELGISIASVVLRGEPTGVPEAFLGDVVATAKRDLVAGERLDGEGGFTVFGRLMPAPESVAMGGLPLGLADGVTLARGVAAGTVVRWRDVRIDAAREVVRVRREMESQLSTARDPAATETAG